VDTVSNLGLDSDDWEDVEIKFYSDDPKRLLLAAKKLYGDYGFKTDSSCGMHMHLRFPNTKNVVGFLSLKGDTYDYFREKYREFAESQRTDTMKRKYLNRLNVGSSGHWCDFCYREDDVRSEIEAWPAKGGARYHAINLNSYGPHKTIELREMPNATSYEEVKRDMLWTAKTIDEMLDTFKNNTHVEAEIPLPRIRRNPPEETFEIEVYDERKRYS
jgi:hypothetical protein